MSEKSKYPNRRSVRLKDYDYSNEGAYFVTVCTYGKKCLLGRVNDGRMWLNEMEIIVDAEWRTTVEKRSNIILDTFVVMPNHIHGIIVIQRRGELNSPVNTVKHINRGRMQYSPTNKFQSPKQSLGAIIRGFKSAVTKHVRRFVSDPKYAVWQRNYYEHVIHNELDLNEVRGYIDQNPMKWELDKYYTN